MQPPTDPSWDLYPQTILEFETDAERVRIDLREVVPQALAARLAQIRPGVAFGIVTSDNPHGRPRPAGENEDGRRALARELEARGVFYLPADGVSPDGSHREQGFAAWLDLEDARRIAREYGQSAFFWFDGRAFRIEGGAVEAPPQVLPIDPVPGG